MKEKILVPLFLGLILFLAACGGNSTEQTEESSPSGESSTSNQLEIAASNWEFDQAEYTVNAGEEVKITLANDEGMHGIAIDELDVNIEGDGEATFTPDEPGEYTIYCSVPCGEGHADMKSTLIVQ